MNTRPDSQAAPPEPPRARSWLALDLEHLARRLPASPGRAHVDLDILIVGSGYGGAMAAATLAGGRFADGGLVRLAVLERGKEYLPGAFPSRMADLPGHLRFSSAGGGTPRGNREGLFDVRIGPDVGALVANGLGGGSLINAGVMATPGADIVGQFDARYGDLGPFLERAGALLGARTDAGPNTILSRPFGEPPAKFAALQRLAAGLPAPVTASAAPITVAMTDKLNGAGIALDACVGCGDCATGCNFNAKESLDTNLLVRAQRQGAELFTGATVLRITHEAAEPGAPERWCAHVVFTDLVLRSKHKHPFRIYCSQLILAAGTFGSTEILLRSRTDTLTFSSMLGQKFSSNGDMIAVAYAQPFAVNAVADEDADPARRAIGPTITGMLQADGVLIEEMAVPGPLRRLFEEVVTTANTLHTLGRPDASEHTADGVDPCAVDRDALHRSTILALMGDDGAQGALELTGEGRLDGDGAVRVRWPGLRESGLFKRQMALLATYATAAGSGQHQVRILPNPIWKLLPADLAHLLSNQHGPSLTVHPLGGCPMGDSATNGVVNPIGQVFMAAPTPADSEGLYRTLAVLDGAIVPLALGVNPALTIAAVALRAAEALRDAWGLAPPVSVDRHERRPRFRIVPTPLPAAETAVQFVERMAGPLTLTTGAGKARDCMVELTMPFDAQALGSLVLPRDGKPVRLRRQLVLGAKASLQVYDRQEWDAWKLRSDKILKERPKPLVSAGLSGTLTFFHREPSRRWQRTWRAFGPWLLNRGMRDTWQWAEERIREGGFFRKQADGKGPWEDVRQRFGTALALASRAGEVRLFDYDLRMGPVSEPHPDFDGFGAASPIVHGVKRLTYGRAGNPWRQLMQLTLDAFPAMAPGSPCLLELDTGFLINEDIALLRVLTQQDQPGALSDLAALGCYVLRLLLTLHVWSFRKPDPPPQRSAQRLPGSVRGLPEPRIRELDTGRMPDGRPVHARLTRYLRDDMPASLAPVMMVHGYSASGTSFAHPLVVPNLASHLWKQGHDVWILDLRTSSGMPFARHAWTFEDAALADIPAAVDHICRETGRPKIDIVAHCMGAAMFSMAVLRAPAPGERFFNERKALPHRIKRAVLSQVGPLVVFSQANIFRAYLMGYLNRVLPLAGYTFRVEGQPTLIDELLDRVLSTLPYPEQEFHLENPVWPWRRTPFTGTRHRMDALYGRDFSLANVGPAILDNIDDFFGPLSIDTVSQAIHLARHKTICNRAGRNVYVSRRSLKQRWTFDTLSVHGADNGLSDVATLGRMRAVFADAGVTGTLHVQAFAGFGHQDCLIGREATRVHGAIGEFLAGRRPLPDQEQQEQGAGASVPKAPNPLLARMPYCGPVRAGFASVRDDGNARSQVGCATDPILPDALLVMFLPVTQQDGRFCIAGAPSPNGGRFPEAMELYTAMGDVNGFMVFHPRPPPPGADGTLVLILYDTSELMESGFLPSDLLKNPQLRGFDLMQAFAMSAMTRAHAPLAALPGPVLVSIELLQQVVAFLREIAACIVDAVESELARHPAAALAGALLTGSAYDAGQQNIPAAAPGKICFAAGSCQYPAGMLDRIPAFASYRRLAALLDRPDGRQQPEFLILMGDQIYADATAGLFDPTDSDDRYVRPYEKLFSNREVRSVLGRLPVFMMLDDHEIADNWERGEDPLAYDPHWNDGCRSFLTYQRNALPPHKQRLWTQWEVNGVQFFMADTRSERGPRTLTTAADASIMGDDQWIALTRWLEQQRDAPAGKPCFIVTSSILAPLRLGGRAAADDDGIAGLRSDAWEGYPASRNRLLGLISRLGLRNVVFLSGDEHISIDASITLQAQGRDDIVVRSIHSSGLYAPYPFANASRADFGDNGHGFGFPDPGAPAVDIRCTVHHAFSPGDGFAVISVEQGAAGTWVLDCHFER